MPAWQVQSPEFKNSITNKKKKKKVKIWSSNHEYYHIFSPSYFEGPANSPTYFFST
jgi:hypothetical protein